MSGYGIPVFFLVKKKPRLSPGHPMSCAHVISQIIV
nr:MAG TPA: hypothetical protein [Caudoviricetes sp.]